MSRPTVAHALVVPSPVSALRVWCGRLLESVRDDLIATSPEAITCDGCVDAMATARQTLDVWAPRAVEAMRARRGSR